MKITFVISTLSRVEELKSLLTSIHTHLKFKEEVLIIDQNFNDSLDDIIRDFKKKLDIIHYKVDFRSLSMAKNFGIKKASGDYICFPDDDSEFLENSIDIAIDFLNKRTEYDLVFGKCIDRDGNDSVINFNKKSAQLTLNNFEGKFIEATLFGKTNVFKKHLFDENLGVGTLFGAEEGYDLIFRLLKSGYKLYFHKDVLFYHPQVINDYGSFSAFKRVFTYRLGFAYLCMKHKFYRKFILRIIFTFFAILIYIFFDIKKSKYYAIETFSLAAGAILSSSKQK